MHIRRGRKEMHIPKGKRYSFMRKPCLLYACFLVSLWCFELCLVSFMLLLLSSHHAYVLDMHLSLYYCALLIACSDNHLLCYMIIVIISIWLSCVWSSCLYVSQHVYLIAFYLLHYTCYILCKCFKLQVYMFQVHHNF